MPQWHCPIREKRNLLHRDKIKFTFNDFNVDWTTTLLKFLFYHLFEKFLLNYPILTGVINVTETVTFRTHNYTKRKIR